MRILYWTPLFWPEMGGIEVLAIKTLPAMQARGYQFMVITSHGELELPDKTDFGGIPVYRFPFRQALAKHDLTSIRITKERISALKREFKARLVHLHYPGHTAYFHMMTAKLEPVPTLLTIHTPFPGIRSDPSTLFGQVVRSATWVTAVSKATLSDTIESVPEIRNRSSVIYNGLPLPNVRSEPLVFDSPRILCVGRLAHEKGVDVLLSALSIVRQQFPQARLTIAGDGPDRLALQQQTAALGLENAVEFVGWIPPAEVPELINQSTMVIVPSRYREPFGLIAVEAAHLARPVVASRTGGLPEVVIDGKTGILFENENPRALADSVLNLLNHPEKAKALGEAGYRRALEHFSQERFVDAYDRLYQRLVETAA